MLFMSMGRDYVSELRPPTGMLFIISNDYMHKAVLLLAMKALGGERKYSSY
jgi:hypothetical protein